MSTTTQRSIGAAIAKQANRSIETGITSSQVDQIDDLDFASTTQLSKSPKQIGYTPSLYNKYYSASDFKIRISLESSEGIWLDKASGVAVSESLSSSPIYTLGNSMVDFFSKGNQVVTGVLSVNTVSADYISKVLGVLNGRVKAFKYLTTKEQLALSVEQLKEYKKQREAHENQSIEVLSTLGFSDYPLFDIELEYNNSDAIQRVTSFSREIKGCRIIGFEQAIDIGNDGQLVDGYRFIAKEII